LWNIATTEVQRKYYKNARVDLKELGIRPELYAEETETGTNLPVAATTLSKVERKEFCHFLSPCQTETGPLFTVTRYKEWISMDTRSTP
jgi:hypothetical protein